MHEAPKLSTTRSWLPIEGRPKVKAIHKTRGTEGHEGVCGKSVGHIEGHLGVPSCFIIHTGAYMGV